MTAPDFVSNGNLTASGKELVEWLEVNIAEALEPGASPSLLNSLPGPLQEYATLNRTAQLAPERWMSTFKQSAVNAWDLKEVLAAKVRAEAEAAAKLTETSDKTNDLAAKLAKLEENLSAKVGELETEIAALRAENEALKTGKGRGKKETKAEAETETPATEE